MSSEKKGRLKRNIMCSRAFPMDAVRLSELIAENKKKTTDLQECVVCGKTKICTEKNEDGYVCKECMFYV